MKVKRKISFPYSLLPTPYSLFLAFALFLLILFSPAAQETGDYPLYEDDDFFDDYLFMEGEGLTIVGTINTTQQM
jgi:hypothetical protein